MNYKTVSFKNIDIAYTEQGKGSALIMLHGFLENAAMWQKITKDFSKRFRIIAIDLLGHGKTGCLGYMHSMEDMADAVFAVISELKLRKVTLVGHSMGGYVSLAFAELYPDRVKSMILINSTARPDNKERIENRNRAIELIKQNSAAFVNMAINNLFSDEIRPFIQSEIKHTKQEALKTPVQGIIAALEGMKIRIDREVILHFAPYPIALILGNSDPVMPYIETAEQIQNTETILFTLKGGHMLHIEAPQELSDSIQNFLKRI